MIRRLLTIFLLLASAGASVTVRAKLTDGTGTVSRTAFLRFQLQNCGPNTPADPTLGVATIQTQFDLRPNQPDGSILYGNLISNDDILCGGVASTYYVITPMKDQLHPLRDGLPFVLHNGDTFDPSVTQPMVTFPPAPPQSPLCCGAANTPPPPTPPTTCGILPGTTNEIVKYINGPCGRLGDSSGTDDGTHPTRWPNGITVGSGGYYRDLANSSSPGTAVNLLVDRDINGAAETAPAGATKVIGISGVGAGTVGTVSVLLIGYSPLICDGQTVLNDYFIMSPTTPGECHDTGGTLVPGALGVITIANSGADTLGTVEYFPANNGGGSSGSGTVGPCNSLNIPGPIGYFTAIQKVDCDDNLTTDGAGNGSGQSFAFYGLFDGFNYYTPIGTPVPFVAPSSVYVVPPPAIAATYGLQLPLEGSGCLEGVDGINSNGDPNVSLAFTGNPCVAGSGTITEVDTVTPITGGPVLSGLVTVACPSCMVNSPTNQTTGILSGGGVFCSTTTLTCTVSAAVYVISGTLFTSPQTTVTLAAADPTNPRIDVIAVDSTGSVIVLTGTPAASPSQPTIDPTTQIEDTFVTIAATATVVSGVSNTNIYLENTEWTSSTNSVPHINVASTNFPFAGTKDVEGTTVAAANYVQFVKPAAGTENLANYANLVIEIQSKAAWASAKALTFTWFNGSTSVGAAVSIKTGVLGFNSSLTGVYQQVVIPTASFATGSNLVTTLRITTTGGGGSIGWYLDNIILQAGIPNAGGSGFQLQTNGSNTLNTANLNDSSPAAAANGLNVKVQRTDIGTISNISMYLPGDGNSSHCLLGTGVFGACSVSSTAFQVDGTPLTSATTVNFQDSSAFNGLTFTFSNPSAGNVKGGFSGTLGNGGLTNSSVTYNGQAVALGATGNVNVGAAAHSIALNQGNGSALTGLALTDDQIALGHTGADPTAAALPSCADSAGNHLNYTHAGGVICGTSTPGTGGNCAANGTAASPSVVSCSGNVSGAFSCATNASAATCTVNTTAVTANSEILVHLVADEGTRLSVTCNTVPTTVPAIYVATKTAATGFTINMPTIATNPACFDYEIVN